MKDNINIHVWVVLQVESKKLWFPTKLFILNSVQTQTFLDSFGLYYDPLSHPECMEIRLQAVPNEDSLVWESCQQGGLHVPYGECHLLHVTLCYPWKPAHHIKLLVGQLVMHCQQKR